MGICCSLCYDADDNGAVYTFMNQQHWEEHDNYLQSTCVSIDTFIVHAGPPVKIEKYQNGFHPRDTLEEQFISKYNSQITHRLEYTNFTAFAKGLLVKRDGSQEHHYIFHILPFTSHPSGLQ